jgi:hypothetical protein
MICITSRKETTPLAKRRSDRILNLRGDYLRASEMKYRFWVSDPVAFSCRLWVTLPAEQSLRRAPLLRSPTAYSAVCKLQAERGRDAGRMQQAESSLGDWQNEYGRRGNGPRLHIFSNNLLLSR